MNKTNTIEKNDIVYFHFNLNGKDEVHFGEVFSVTKMGDFETIVVMDEILNRFYLVYNNEVLFSSKSKKNSSPKYQIGDYVRFRQAEYSVDNFGYIMKYENETYFINTNTQMMKPVFEREILGLSPKPAIPKFFKGDKVISLLTGNREMSIHEVNYNSFFEDFLYIVILDGKKYYFSEDTIHPAPTPKYKEGESVDFHFGSSVAKTGKIKKIYNFEGEFNYVIEKGNHSYSTQEDSIIGLSVSVPENCFHAFYSRKHAMQNGRYSVYETLDGRDVMVTHAVLDGEYSDVSRNYQWDDAQYVGIVKKFKISKKIKNTQ